MRAVVSSNFLADLTFPMPEIFHALGLHMHQPPGNLVALGKALNSEVMRRPRNDSLSPGERAGVRAIPLDET